MPMMKNASISVKAGTDDGLMEGEFTAYASVFDNKDSYGDVVRKGAFAESIKTWQKSGNTVPVLYGHDFGDPFSNIGSALELKEDDRGLYVKGVLDLDNPKAAQVYRLLKGRRLSQLSFAYDVEEGAQVTSTQSKADGDDELGDYFELRKLKLYEVSLVPIGANPETEVLAVKHAATVIKSGRTISAKNEIAIKEAIEKLQSVLHEDTSSTAESEASEQEPSKSEATDEAASSKATPDSTVEDLARYLALKAHTL